MNKPLINLKRIILALKISLACIVSVFIAQSLGLQYAPAAGIITILSIQNTKRETLSVALTRLIAFVVAMVIAYVSFNLLGYNIKAFGVYIVIYIFLCVIFKWQSAMAVNSVLITHFWAAQSMSKGWILNEVQIFAIGVSIGILVNFTLRRNRKRVDELKGVIETDMQKVLIRMSKELVDEDKSDYDKDDFEGLEKDIEIALAVTYESANNSLDREMQRHLSYIYMRKNQAQVLRQIYENILLLDIVPEQGRRIAKFVNVLSEHIKEANDVNINIAQLEELKASMKKEPLPQTRQEFENRAILYQMLYQFEEFLLHKKDLVVLK